MKLLAILAAILTAGAAAAEPIIIRVTMPDGTVATERIAAPRVVSNAVARLDRDTAGASTNSAAARQALEIKQRLVALAFDYEKEIAEQADEADKQARREAREADKQAALQAAGGQ